MSDEPTTSTAQAAWEELGAVREPGEVLAAAVRAGLLPAAGDVAPVQRASAVLLLRVLDGLYVWQGPARREIADAPEDGAWAGYFDVSGRAMQPARPRLVESGAHDELMARAGVYAELYGMQAEAYLRPASEL